MKIDFTVDVLGRAVLRASPGVYDGTPSAPDLILDVSLDRIPSARLALAEALVCVGSVSGELILDSELHPATAEILSQVMPDRWVHVSPIRFSPVDIPQGSLKVKVCEGDFPSASWTDGSAEDLWLTLLPADRFIGNIASLRSRWLATNMNLVGRSPDPSRDTWHRRLATLVLLSHELDARQFVIPQNWTDGITNLHIYVQILRTVGLSLITTSPEETE